MNPLRALAEHLMGHAAKVMPAARQGWIEAMRAEVHHITDDRSAAAFALGCVQVSYAQGITTMATLVGITRWSLAALALAWAGFLGLASVLIIEAKVTPDLIAAELGREPESVDALQFLLAYPAWEVAVTLIATGLLLAGALQLLRARPEAFALLATAVTLGTFLGLVDLQMADAATQRPMLSPAALLTPLICLIPLWWLRRRAARA